MDLQGYLRLLMVDRARLSRGEARGLMEVLLAGAGTEMEVAAVMGALGGRGETAEEIAGFVDGMRAVGTGLPLTDAERDELVDTCGTGGDGSGTFNISTAAALVAAAAGAKVAKHGNRAVTSNCGSGDVLEALGIPVGLSGEEAAGALRRFGFVFLHAPGHHPAMRAVMPVRRALGVRTVFNLLGPLANPAGARAQVMGVYGPGQVQVAAEAMVLLGVRHAFVVHGDAGEVGGMDEFSICGGSRVAEVRDGVMTMREVVPEEFGLRRAAIGELAGGDAGENAGVLRRIFAGERGARRDVVVLNAAAVLVVAGLAGNLLDGIRLAEDTIDAGAVDRLVSALIERREEAWRE